MKSIEIALGIGFLLAFALGMLLGAFLVDMHHKREAVRYALRVSESKAQSERANREHLLASGAVLVQLPTQQKVPSYHYVIDE